MTMLMVEHELAIMDEFCDPVIVMAEGAVLAEGTMAAAARTAPRSWRPTLSAERRGETGPASSAPPPLRATRSDRRATAATR